MDNTEEKLDKWVLEKLHEEDWFNKLSEKDKCSAFELEKERSYVASKRFKIALKQLVQSIVVVVRKVLKE